MSIAELKVNLINRIAETAERGIIEELSKLLDFELDSEIYQLSPEQEQRICEAKTEYFTGDILSEKHADEEIEQWLSEK